MNLNRFAHTTPSKSLSPSKGGAVNLRNSSFRTNPDIAKAYFGWVGSLLVAAAGMVGGVAAQKSEGAVMLKPGTTLPGSSYITFGQSVSNGRVLPGLAQRADGSLFYNNIIRINERFGLTIDLQNHSSTGPITLLDARSTLPTVDNQNPNANNPSAVRPIINIIRNPLGLDANIVEFGGTAMPGEDLITALPPQTHEIANFAAFGNFALINGVVFNQDGYERGWQMIKNSRVTSQFNSTIHSRYTIDETTLNSVIYPGGGEFNDSAGLVENLSGQAIGMILSKGGSLGDTGSFQSITTLDFKPDFNQWVFNTSNIVPEPNSAAAFLLIFSSAFLKRTRR